MVRLKVMSMRHSEKCPLWDFEIYGILCRKKNTMLLMKFLLAITNGIWLIEPSYAQAQMPLVKSIMDGNFKSPKNKTIKHGLYALAISPTSRVNIDSETNRFDTAETGSVAIFKVCGPIMKEDGECGEPGTARLCEAIDEAAANSNIIGAVFIFDSPGGTVSGTEEFANCIREFNKPKIGIVEDMCASAAYWAISQCDKVYACNSSARIGSIGTMVSFSDMQPYWEAQGVKFHEIYAPASVDKNRDFNEARKGNYALVKETLAGINDIFIKAVTSARPGLNDKETLTGKMFLAADAEKMGLTDGYMCEEDAVSEVRAMASGSNNNNSINNQNKTEMKIKATLTALVAFVSSAFPDKFKADETLVTEEHLEKINGELATLAGIKEAKETAETALALANTAKAEIESNLATTTTAKVAAETKVGEMQAEINRLCKLNPGATSVFKIKEEAAGAEEEATDNEFYSEMDAKRDELRSKA